MYFYVIDIYMFYIGIYILIIKYIFQDFIFLFKYRTAKSSFFLPITPSARHHEPRPQPQPQDNPKLENSGFSLKMASRTTLMVPLLL